MPSNTLAELAEVTAGTVHGNADVVISDVTHDSREVSEGVLFVAVRGFAADGHGFVAQAAERGASAACVDELQAVSIPQLQVADTRSVLAALAASVHGQPSAHLRVVGITGTNGKTTVAHMLESITRAAGLPTGLIGTIGARSGDRPLEVRRTTPEATDLQRMFAEMVKDGIDVVAMEVSSHALTLGRVASTGFRIGAFTNLSQDHLDFHADMEEYFAAKAALFDQTERAVINTDSEWGRRLRDMVEVPVTTVGTDADIAVSEIEAALTESRFRVDLDGTTIDVVLPIPGAFNISNALVAAGCAHHLGISLGDIKRGLEEIPPVAGRFEVIPHDGAFGVVVDYAHTPEGIELVIDAARGVSSGRVIALIGAGGDRDRFKRPLMGAAGAAADLLWVTSDNPRSEDPAAIISDVMDGVGTTTEVRVEVDRAKAIADAIAEAGPGDLVLILGKGHEQGQDLGDRVIPFDDRVVAKAALRGDRA